jgi:PAS domain S-box-containing protein
MTVPQDLVDSLVFRTAPIGIAVVDSTTGEICHLNDSLCEILGRTRTDIVGKNWMAFTHPDDVSDDLSCVGKLSEKDSGNVYREKRYLRPDGSVVPVGVTMAPLPFDGKNRTHVTMIQNLAPAMRMRAELREKTKIVSRARESAFTSMAILSEFRDRETGEHILRTKSYVKLLFDNLPFPHPYSRKAIALIVHSAMLHDIGKVGIPDSILLKPGKLTKEEFEIMKTHTTLGHNAIEQTRKNLDNDTVFMFAAEIAQSHHERWDGSGYPRGLRGDQIPLTARVMAIADVYDALISVRPYKKAYSHQEAVEIIRKESGSHFDPKLVSLFCSLEKKIEEIAALERHELKARLEEEHSPY